MDPITIAIMRQEARIMESAELAYKRGWRANMREEFGLRFDYLGKELCDALLRDLAEIEKKEKTAQEVE